MVCCCISHTEMTIYVISTRTMKRCPESYMHFQYLVNVLNGLPEQGIGHSF